MTSNVKSSSETLLKPNVIGLIPIEGLYERLCDDSMVDGDIELLVVQGVFHVHGIKQSLVEH